MKKLLLLSLCVTIIFTCSVDKDTKKEINTTNIRAKKMPKINVYHLDTIIDNYILLVLFPIFKVHLQILKKSH